MQIMLLGLPGAGKGTQAAKIQERYGIPHISTGDMFRAAIAAGTPLGLEVQDYLNSGKLVPDELTIRVVRDRLEQPDAKDGFLLDGFPRTLQQADALQKLLSELERNLNAVLYLHVPQNILMDRLTGRRICRQCGATYHLVLNPPKVEGTCDVCGGELYQRADDTPEAVKTRLEQYAQTAPLVDYYQSQGVLYTFDGLLTIDHLFEQIVNTLDKLRK
ncbi:adenylate kinase [Alicyclobacillus tolerans]|uniref:Adenylate kinase n=1 Tax=Alicyclobacillus tolerans TaxID=90970 RepID=A0ABT9LW70_9BACL|nr:MULTISPECIES: adenylate kinase [Alicyclobacillus]MDP9728523.1 adenylate kinase [Alicyclobacillus tengchongensis]QRF22523.1 adenylate kinase [Alicyclobacillus sp. TC]